MNLVLRISDELALRLGASAPDLERQALEALMLESFRAGRITIGGMYDNRTVDDIDREVETLTKLGF